MSVKKITTSNRPFYFTIKFDRDSKAYISDICFCFRFRFFSGENYRLKSTTDYVVLDM